MANAEGRAENVMFGMALNLKAAQVTLAALSSVAATNEKVRIIRQESLESSEGSFTDESGSGQTSSKVQRSNGGVKKTVPQPLYKPKSLEPKEYTLSAECSMRKGDEIIFKCDADHFDRNMFTCKIQTFQRVTRGKEPTTGQWYELKLRFFTKSTTDLPRVDVSYVKAIDPPETPYASSRPVQAGSPTSSMASASATFPRSASSTSITTPAVPKLSQSPVATTDKDEGPNEYTLSARVTDVKGEEAFFECPAGGFRPSAFICNMKGLPVSPRPTVGQWYELRLTFSERSLKQHAKPHVYVSRAKLIPKPVTPYYSCRTRQLNPPQCASPAPSGVSIKPNTEYGTKGDPLSEEEQLVVFILSEVSDMYKLCAPKRFQSPSRSFNDVSPALGKWYNLKAKFPNPGYAYVSDVKPASPLLPTRVINEAVEIQTRLTPGKPLDGVPCGMSEELGRVVDMDGIAGSAFKGSSWSSIDCWCTRRDYASDPSLKASWKVVSLVGSGKLSNGVSKLSMQDGSTAGPSLNAQKDAITKKGCTGVVCYKEGDLCYVYSPQLGCEALLENPPTSIEAGQWLEFNAILGDDKEYLAVDHKEIKAMFTSSPMFRSVVIECEVMVPMRVEETDRTVSSNFIGEIRDVYGLVSKVDPGVHKATIRYIYEEGSPSGYWQLEYIRVKKAS
ncbi:hypothetical protein AAVH_08915 [Aphelenchoides avenae]|nr:hypothetical protein AAVH_08915 [Aphelenchus avenae]